MPPSTPPLLTMIRHGQTHVECNNYNNIILYESRASRVGTRCIIKYYNNTFMPVASGTAASRGGRTTAVRHTFHPPVVRTVRRSKCDGLFGEQSVVGCLWFAAVVASAAAPCLLLSHSSVTTTRRETKYA